MKTYTIPKYGITVNVCSDSVADFDKLAKITRAEYSRPGARQPPIVGGEGE